ncbi:MAG: aminotransferase class III-fold pyridoxal phosphate-dependent enzyme [Deltaproteobacteria bacterium]|jgi:taurine--2-oxoglutarate transaminase|nr:aminotransferase class III-fold pyridoxal phosphate-dependent enzyme [Deltaproteobacteria bacterium]MBW2536946.1 aminotransferase class III-fold pyridoxal phosphate-dependent enzyme [Deltaproteobacteria bacterium]
MKADEMIDLCKRHTVFSWSAQGSVAPLAVERGEGIYFWDPDGKRYIDFNCQLMCNNLGHNHPKLVQAIKEQADKLFYVFPGAVTEPRARLGKLLSEVVPGDINKFFFTNGGAEANEAAIKIARLYTGRHKIISRYRSYHGGTHGAMQLTGDPRRWATEPGAPGFIKVLDPRPYRYSFGETDEERTKNNLEYLAEVIDYEGPHNIAAMFIEPVVGTNGIMPPPKGYLQGLRKLLDQHGILLVCDEVMAGFGRTGKMFSFMHGDIQPDLICMAKGLTSAALPLGAMGMRDEIAAHFDENVFWTGLTYSCHAMSLAAGVAAVQALLDEKVVDRVAKLEPVMREHMAALAKKHPSVGECRATGLFGAMEFRKNAAGEPLTGYNQAHPAVGKLVKALIDKGLFTMAHWNYLFCNPPLIISEEQLGEAFAILDGCLSITDEHFEG